ncbi:BTB/POZ domain-containing protein KCTD4-like [Saccostrea echinata]|uniref:BTB/POZ domain-containing protein KCTD4-like n=1 Tax=Saccostrea echinata TaxID=191078 RepID=UPI002A81529E|nr:BTB/POZ domain-containing protein KCTD4-like [Saccostrea echinata]
MAIQRMADRAPRDKILKLNVGGVFYTTAKSTLTSVYGSYLWRVATGDATVMRDEKGSLFIDRDGYVFRYVLNFLRSDRLIVPQGYKELHMLREEAEFFGLEDLCSQVDKVIKSRRRKPRPRLTRRFSRSWGSDLTKISTDENGSVIFEDEGSDYFYD